MFGNSFKTHLGWKERKDRSIDETFLLGTQLARRDQHFGVIISLVSRNICT